MADKAKKARATEVLWVNLYSEIYNDGKIRMIKHMNGGTEMLWIWVCLICLAGKTNQAGTIPIAGIDQAPAITGRFAYTYEMLATLFDVEPDAIRNAFRTFQGLGMIEIIQHEDGEYSAWLPNFEKHQYAQRQAEIRENNRLRKQRQRAKIAGEMPLPELPEAEVPYEDIVKAYHELCPDLPHVQRLTDKRKSLIRARYKEYDCDIKVIEEVFKKAGESEFLNGNNDRGWRANFDWILNVNNFVKVYEGRYDNREGGTNHDNNTDSADYSSYAELH